MVDIDLSKGGAYLINGMDIVVEEAAAQGALANRKPQKERWRMEF